MNTANSSHTVEEESAPGWAAGIGALLVLAGAILLVYLAVSVIGVIRNPDSFGERLDRMEATIRGPEDFASMTFQLEGSLLDAAEGDAQNRATAEPSLEGEQGAVHAHEDGRGKMDFDVARPAAVLVYLVLAMILASVSKCLIAAGAKLIMRRWRFSSTAAKEHFRIVAEKRSSGDITET